MSEVVHYAGAEIDCAADVDAMHRWSELVTCPACLVWLAIDCLERAAKVEPERARMRIDEVVDRAMGMREVAA